MCRLPSLDSLFYRHMSYVIKQSTTETLRMRLEFLRNYHLSVVRSGDERLRAAMMEYREAFHAGQELEAA